MSLLRWIIQTSVYCIFHRETLSPDTQQFHFPFPHHTSVIYILNPEWVSVLRFKVNTEQFLSIHRYRKCANIIRKYGYETNKKYTMKAVLGGFLRCVVFNTLEPHLSWQHWSNSKVLISFYLHLSSIRMKSLMPRFSTKTPEEEVVLNRNEMSAFSSPWKVGKWR